MKTTKSTPAAAAGSLYRRVAHRLLSRFRGRLPVALIDRALAEVRQRAEAAGWPLLVFPLLAEETVAQLARVSEEPTFGFCEAA